MVKGKYNISNNQIFQKLDQRKPTKCALLIGLVGVLNYLIEDVTFLTVFTNNLCVFTVEKPISN